MQSTHNRLHFALRNFINWPGPPYYEPNADKASLFINQPDIQQQANQLEQRYELAPLLQKASKTRYLETLTYLDWLDCLINAAPEAFQAVLQSNNPTWLPKWLDVGAKNWSYVLALAAFLQKHTPDFAIPFELHGIELDPHRRYVDLRTRSQVASAYIKQLPPDMRAHTHYHAGNILKWQQPARIISHFLPFVFKEPHLAWGLPLNTFKPEAILMHELSLLESPGLLLIVNQGETEAEAQQALLTAAATRYPIRFQSLGQLPARFIQYQYPRYGWICIKHDSDDTDSHPGIPQ